MKKSAENQKNGQKAKSTCLVVKISPTFKKLVKDKGVKEPSQKNQIPFNTLYFQLGEQIAWS